MGALFTVTIPPAGLKPGMEMFAPEYSAPRTVESVRPLLEGESISPHDRWQIDYAEGGGRTWPGDRDVRIY